MRTPLRPICLLSAFALAAGGCGEPLDERLEPVPAEITDLESVVDQAEPLPDDPAAASEWSPEAANLDDAPYRPLRTSGERSLSTDGEPDETPDRDPPDALHEIAIQTPEGPRTVVAEERGGDLYVEGDIRLGHVDDLFLDPGDGIIYLAALPAVGDRFRVTVPFTIDSGLSTTIQGRVQDAMDLISQRSGIQFVARTSHTDYINFIADTGSSSPVGRQGGRQDIRLSPTASVGTAAHEILHSLGFWHEQSRTDRNSFVTYDESCVQAGREFNFDIATGSLPLGPYDLTSILHYGSNFFCNMDTNGVCLCLPLERRPGVPCPAGTCTDFDGDGFDEAIVAQRTQLSNNDINSVAVTYSPRLGTNETYENHGDAVAIGDFDGDGFDDVAVGAPFEDSDGGGAAGAVYLYKGTPSGLTTWRILTQETRRVNQDGSLGPGMGINEANDRFGSALATGDFNGDGIDDLAVGAFGEAPGSDPAYSGAVFLYLGYANVAGDGRHGLQAWMALNQESTGFGGNEFNDRFGYALASADFDADGFDDLAVGAPLEAPGSDPASGFVFVYRGGTSGMVKWKGLKQSSLSRLEAGERFGEALEAVDLNQDGFADLAVGSPGERRAGLTNAGAVFLFKGSSSTLSPWALLDESALGTIEANDQFGISLASGDFNRDYKNDLAIGSPGNGGGRVHVYLGRREELSMLYAFFGPILSLDRPSPWKIISQSGLGANETGDRFGWSMAAADVDRDGDADLLVGAPYEKPGGDPAASGYVFLFKGSSVGFSPYKGRSQEPLDDNELYDVLGTSMAAGDVNGDGWIDFAVGAPGQDFGSANAAGAVFVFDYVTGRDDVIGVFAPVLKLHQELRHALTRI